MHSLGNCYRWEFELSYKYLTFLKLKFHEEDQTTIQSLLKAALICPSHQIKLQIKLRPEDKHIGFWA